jgi:hypothetical protein
MKIVEESVAVHKYLPDAFAHRNGLKEGGGFKPLFLNFALRYSITNVQQNEERVEVNDMSINQLLVNAASDSFGAKI